MQDACRASFNAIIRVHPNTIILMFYFHVMDNIIRKKHLIKNENAYDELMDVLRDIYIHINIHVFLESMNMNRKKHNSKQNMQRIV